MAKPESREESKPAVKLRGEFDDPLPDMSTKKHKQINPAEFFSAQLSLLEKERQAEVSEISDAIALYSPSQLQSRGLALLNLTITSVRTGLGGKTWGLYKRKLIC